MCWFTSCVVVTLSPRIAPSPARPVPTPALLLHTAGDCPLGDDLLTTGNVNEIQLFSCRQVVASNFYLTYKQQTTGPIPRTATPSQVEAALEALSTMQDVRVTFFGLDFLNAPIVQACHNQAIVMVEFLQEFGEYVQRLVVVCGFRLASCSVALKLFLRFLAPNLMPPSPR